jgi:pimeloyl-ACP methyl ester carboxylesterase
MPFEKINNLQVYYEVHGEGEAIILMHHGFGCTKIWKDIYPRLAAQGYKVVAYDRRGFGRSERGDDFPDFYETDRYRPESVEELRILKEILGIKECHLVGQCEGGVVGVDYAVKYPREVKTLTVASTQCYGEVTMVEFNATKFAARSPIWNQRLRRGWLSGTEKRQRSTTINLSNTAVRTAWSILTSARPCLWFLALPW